jgi:hypothetical protein
LFARVEVSTRATEVVYVTRWSADVELVSAHCGGKEISYGYEVKIVSCLPQFPLWSILKRYLFLKTDENIA